MSKSEWKCCGCGKVAIDKIRNCDCATGVLFKTEGGQSVFESKVNRPSNDDLCIRLMDARNSDIHLVWLMRQDASNEITRLRARIKDLESAQGARVPEEYVLVPKEPTQEMVRFAHAAQPGAINVGFADAYRSMLCAAPPAHSAPSREPMTVTDEMVERANVAYETAVRELYEQGMHKPVCLEEIRAKSMRAALHSALGQEKG